MRETMRNFRDKIKSDCGYIVVETVGAFLPFVLLVVSILSLINIITFQVRMHYALTQAAGTLSMYSYVLHAAGIADELSVSDARSSEFANVLEDVLDGVDALGSSSFNDSGLHSETDPVELIRNFAAYGLGGIRGRASVALAEPLVMHYLTNGSDTAEEYFRRLRVRDFELSDCVIVDGNGDVRITADYKIEYTFGALSLPGNPALRLTHTVVTKAWLGGSGEGYTFNR